MCARPCRGPRRPAEQRVTVAEEHTHQYVTALIKVRARRVLVTTVQGEVIYEAPSQCSGRSVDGASRTMSCRLVSLALRKDVLRVRHLRSAETMSCWSSPRLPRSLLPAPG